MPEEKERNPELDRLYATIALIERFEGLPQRGVYEHGDRLRDAPDSTFDAVSAENDGIENPGVANRYFVQVASPPRPTLRPHRSVLHLSVICPHLGAV